MRTRTALTALAISLAILASAGAVSAAGCGGRGPCGAGMGPGMAAKPLFTSEQQGQMEKVRARFEDQRVELHNKMAAMRLEMREMLAADEPDFGKIESRIDEIAAIRVRLLKMRLAQHREIRGLLTAEQKKLFDRGFDLGCGGPCGGGRGGACAGMGAGPMCCPDQGRPGCPMMGGKGQGHACCPMMGGKDQGRAGCLMMGGPGGGAMQGMKQQSEPWRRWL